MCIRDRCWVCLVDKYHAAHIGLKENPELKNVAFAVGLGLIPISFASKVFKNKASGVLSREQVKAALESIPKEKPLTRDEILKAIEPNRNQPIRTDINPLTQAETKQALTLERASQEVAERRGQIITPDGRTAQDLADDST